MRLVIDGRAAQEDPQVHLAMTEHARLCREIEELEADAKGTKSLLAALRMCRAHIEQELRRRGWRLKGGTWQTA